MRKFILRDGLASHLLELKIHDFLLYCVSYSAPLGTNSYNEMQCHIINKFK
jgi:hypothetical protein